MNEHVRSVIEKLQAGESVINKEPGNSMLPIIESRQPVLIEPVDHSKLEKGDVVYVKVKGRVYTHRILALRGDGEVCIGNNRGGVNGWTKLDNVFGIVTEVEGREIGGAKAKVKGR